MERGVKREEGVVQKQKVNHFSFSLLHLPALKGPLDVRDDGSMVSIRMVRKQTGIYKCFCLPIVLREAGTKWLRILN